MNKFTITQTCHCGCNEIRVYHSPKLVEGWSMIQCMRCGSTAEVKSSWLENNLVKVAELYDEDRKTKQPAITTQDVCWTKWLLERGGK